MFVKASSMYSLLLPIILFIRLTYAFPLSSRQDVSTIPSLQDIRFIYPGISWDDVYGGDCTEAQRQIIVTSVQSTVDDIFKVFPLKRDRYDSAAFNRFFIRSTEEDIIEGWSTLGQPSQSWTLIDIAFTGITHFLTSGGFKNGILDRRKQVKYRCNTIEGQRCGPSTVAVTSNPSVNLEGWSTTFCPTFFNSYNHTIDLGKEPTRDLVDLPFLRSYEHAIIHELAHADVASGRLSKDHITDVRRSDFPGWGKDQVINGARLSHMLAWKNANAVPSSIELDVTWNADNFAWVYTNAWFAHHYGWTDDGRTMDLGPGMVDEVPSGDDNPDGSDWESISAELENTISPPPENCWALSDDPTDLYCSYLRGTFDDWLVEKESSFVSTGGCELS